MKIIKYTAIIAALAAAGSVTSCKNSSQDFPDYQGGITVYFANQYPVRTLVMGEDTYDTSVDNAHACDIYATMSGAYKGRKITLDIAVDNSLVDNLTFDGTKPVKAMPESYYTLASNKIDFNGNVMGSVRVNFTDAFFNDPDALESNYVVPLVITGQNGADHILSGTPVAEGNVPPRTLSSAWSVVPKDYVLYCVKYINKYDAEYAVRGLDKVTEGGKTTLVRRHAAHVEEDELRTVDTRNLSTAVYPVSTVITLPGGDKQTLTCDLVLSFDDKDQCTVTSGTPGINASGTGKFVIDGEKKSWGNEDRNAIYLDYIVDYGTRSVQTLDTLVVKSRNVKFETFTPEYK